jgi:hypothetical protein
MSDRQWLGGNRYGIKKGSVEAAYENGILHGLRLALRICNRRYYNIGDAKLTLKAAIKRREGR